LRKPILRSSSCFRITRACQLKDSEELAEYQIRNLNNVRDVLAALTKDVYPEPRT
jgi:hypothetical protein